MSGKVVNLRRARKARARDEARRRGDENAARHGADMASRAVTRFEAEALKRRLDGAKRDDAENDDAG